MTKVEIVSELKDRFGSLETFYKKWICILETVLEIGKFPKDMVRCVCITVNQVNWFWQKQQHQN